MTAIAWVVRAAVTAAAIVVVGVTDARAQDLLPGMFVGTPDGPQELAIYAERSSSGRIMKLPRSPLDDIQHVAHTVRLICNLPNWTLRSVWLSTAQVFTDSNAERRTLTIVQRRLTISAVLVRVVPSENHERWQELLAAVGASAENPAYLFATMESDGLVRDFMVAIDPPSASPR